MRAAAALCGTTHKTVKRVLERRGRRAGRAAAPARGRATPSRSTDLIAAKVKRDRRADHRPSGCCRWLGRPATRARRATFAARWREAKADWRRRAADLSAVGAGRRASIWSSTGADRAGWQVFCAVLAWSAWRFVRFAADQSARDDAAAAGRVLRGARRGAGGGARRSHGLPEGRRGRQRGRAAPRTTCASPPTTGSGPTSARPRTPSRRESSRRWSATPSPTWWCRPRPSVGGPGRGERAGVAWCAEVNAARPLARSSAVPAERLVAERDVLRRAAVAAPADAPRRASARSTGWPRVRFGSARYSVPDPLVGCRWRSRADDRAGRRSRHGELEVARHRARRPG